jgi:hypothetical protein
MKEILQRIEALELTIVLLRKKGLWFHDDSMKEALRMRAALLEKLRELKYVEIE